MPRVGIERVNIYGCSLALQQKNLAESRGKDPQKVIDDYLIDTRALNPVWEDVVTMAVNAATPILTDEIKEQIGLLIVGTEGSPDFGKPISTNVHGALGLPPSVRNFETKHACYSGLAGVNSAIDWVASGNNRGKKALVFGVDFSRKHINSPYEFVLGGLSSAILISDKPEIVEFELGKRGNWTTHIYDSYRPTATGEMGNNEVSLFTYLDALEGAFNDYLKTQDSPIDIEKFFDAFVFHTPFPGMAFQATRSLCNISGLAKSKKEVKEFFNEKVLPALAIARKVGSCYASSNYAGLLSQLLTNPNLKAGDRLGFYAYGSGAIGEFYSAKICEGAQEKVKALNIEEKLNSRTSISVEDYEKTENTRDTYIENPNFTPDKNLPAGHYDRFYKDKGLYVLKEVKDYQRIYEWS